MRLIKKEWFYANTVGEAELEMNVFVHYLLEEASVVFQAEQVQTRRLALQHCTVGRRNSSRPTFDSGFSVPSLGFQNGFRVICAFKWTR